MDTAIRTGLILLAVVAIIAALASVIPTVAQALNNVLSYFTTALNQISPYLVFGKRLFNNFVGNGILANAILIISISLPITFFITTLIVRAYRLIIGK